MSRHILLDVVRSPEISEGVTSGAYALVAPLTLASEFFNTETWWLCQGAVFYRFLALLLFVI